MAMFFYSHLHHGWPFLSGKSPKARFLWETLKNSAAGILRSELGQKKTPHSPPDYHPQKRRVLRHAFWPCRVKTNNADDTQATKRFHEFMYDPASTSLFCHWRQAAWIHLKGIAEEPSVLWTMPWCFQNLYGRDKMMQIVSGFRPTFVSFSVVKRQNLPLSSGAIFASRWFSMIYERWRLKAKTHKRRGTMQKRKWKPSWATDPLPASPL